MSTGIGERIRKRRTELGWSQEELAKHMGFKSKSTICKIEKGEDNLTTTAVKKYADALLTTPSYIMGWEDEEKVDADRIKAERLFELYVKANPEVQQAVETILKSAQPKP